MFVAIVNIQETHLVYSRDMYNNPKLDSSDIYQVILTNNANSQVVVNAVVTSP